MDDIKKYRIIQFAGGIILSLAIVLTSVQVLSWTKTYYDFEFSKLQVEERLNDMDIDLDSNDMDKLTEGISGFLSGRYSSFSVSTDKDVSPLGEKGDFFNEREKSHMKDVLVLFRSGEMVRNLILAMIAATFLICYKKSKKSIIDNLLILSKGSILGVFVIFGLLFMMQYVDFTSYFIKFHELLFKNDLWLLDPYSSLLINLLPEQFFIDFVINTMLLSLAAVALLFAAVFGISKIKK